MVRLDALPRDQVGEACLIVTVLAANKTRQDEKRMKKRWKALHENPKTKRGGGEKVTRKLFTAEEATTRKWMFDGWAARPAPIGWQRWCGFSTAREKRIESKTRSAH